MSGYLTGIIGMSTPLVLATTWNPLDKDSGITLSNGNLTYTESGAGGGARATRALTSGKAYWEVLINQDSGEVGGAWNIGFSLGSDDFTHIAATGATVMVFLVNGNISNITPSLVLGSALVNGDFLCCAIDFTAKIAWFRINGGNWMNSGAADPATGTGGGSFITSGPWYPSAASSAVGTSYTANFGASVFSFAKPTGFAAWNDLI